MPDIARGLAAALEAGAVDGAGVRQRAIAQASKFSWARAAERCVELYRVLG